MKKILSICALLLASLLIFAACNKDEECTSHKDDNADGVCDVCGEEYSQPCTSHTDDDADGKCDVCGAEYSAPAVKVDYTLTVKDQDGAVIPNAELTIYAGFDEAAKGKTDADGKLSCSLTEGQYTLSFDSLPNGYFAYEASTLITVSAEANSTEILVENTIPNGSEERPFSVSLEAPSITLPANTGYYYSIGGGTRILKIEASDIELLYGGETYAPDENGKIEIKLIPESNFSPVVIKFTNKSDAEKTFGLTFESLPGSPERPYESELNVAYMASVDKDSTVYYQWVADRSGILAVISHTEHNTIMLYNKTTMEVSPYTDGKVSEYVLVNVGDELSIAVASTSKEDISEVEFVLTCYVGDASSPIVLLDKSASFSLSAGKEYSFVSSLSGADTLSIKNSSVTVKVNGAELTADENGKIEYIFSTGDVITIKNNAETRCSVTINLSNSAEAETPEE